MRSSHTSPQASHLDEVQGSLATRWTRRLAQRERPTDDDLVAHLLRIHRTHPGFTESCAGRCRDCDGKTTYERLADHVEPGRTRRVLDLACGSGPLTELCWERHGDAIELIGVDMSPDELELARSRLAGTSVQLHEALAQDLDCMESGSVDLVLCHWALTLMKPITPVLTEVARVLRPGGRFVAIVDGEAGLSADYDALNALVFATIRDCVPGYGTIDLGDPRARTITALEPLLLEAFGPGSRMESHARLVGLDGPAGEVAREAVGFFYAALILGAPALAGLEQAATALLSQDGDSAGSCRFEMPITEVIVQKSAAVSQA